MSELSGVLQAFHWIRPAWLLAVPAIAALWWVVRLNPVIRGEDAGVVLFALSALEEQGVADPASRLLLIRGWNTSTLLIKNGVELWDRLTCLLLDEEPLRLRALPGCSVLQ